MERKAKENLEAARLLLAQDDPCSNAAATRAYYAVYHALWATLAEVGDKPPEVRPGAAYFPHQASEEHESIMDSAARRSLLTATEVADVETLRDQRVKADYEADDVAAQEANDCFRAARTIVEKLVGVET